MTCNTEVPHGRSMGDTAMRTALSWVEDRLRLGLHPQMHQTQTDTFEDRYPEIFGSVAEHANKTEGRPRLLSFGCSTGEECITLRRYMPRSSIAGVDVRRSLLRRARQRVKAADVSDVGFFLESDERWQQQPYDVVFAMSVLCRWPATKDVGTSDSIYPFRTFDRAVRRLGHLVKRDGLLVIYNANYRFTDTDTSAGFTALQVPGVTDSGFVTKFSRDGVALEDQSYPYSVFQRGAER
jgi:SAM-dependent methyltransferase